MDDVNELRRELAEMRTDLAAAQQRIRELETRVARRKPTTPLIVLAVLVGVALVQTQWVSAQFGKTTYRAPFEVVDSSGQPVFTVLADVERSRGFGAKSGARGAFVHNSSGKIVAGMVAVQSGGVVRVAKEADMNVYAAIAAFDDGLGFRVRNGDRFTVDLSEKSSRLNAPLEVVDANGKVVLKTNDRGD